MTMFAIFVSLVVLPSMFLAMLLGILCVASMLMRNIDVIVPFLFYEIDGALARIVLAAVLAPVLRMTGRHVHIDGLINNADRRGMNKDGSCVNDFWMGKTTNVNAAVKTGLGDADRDPDIGCDCS